MKLRLLDLGLIAALGAASFGMLRASGLLSNSFRPESGEHVVWAALALVLIALSATVAYISWGTALWISNLHMTSAETPGTAVRHLRKVGRRLPTPYPDAWWAVALSEELKPGQVRPVTVCGHDLIVFRPQATRDRPLPPPSVLSAYCSHLGAHLALGGGRVEGDCVRCPFHGWAFDGKGCLASVPTGSGVPKGGDVMAWPTQERNGVISVWMASHIHVELAAASAGQGGQAAVAAAAAAAAAAGAAPSSSAAASAAPAAQATASDGPSAPRATSTSLSCNEPWYCVPDIPEIGGMVYHGCTENIVNAVLFEIPENGSDVCHLAALHRDFVIPALSRFLSHQWAASWLPGEGPRVHMADIRVEEAICAFERPLPGKVSVQIQQVGPSQVFLHMATPVGRLYIVETVTPVAPLQLRVLHALYAQPHVPRVAAKAVLAATVVQFEKDVPIWCNKKFEPTPVLVAEDSTIKAYRAWAKQFQGGKYPGKRAITFAEAAKIHAAALLGIPLDAPLDW